MKLSKVTTEPRSPFEISRAAKPGAMLPVLASAYSLIKPSLSTIGKLSIRILQPIGDGGVEETGDFDRFLHLRSDDEPGRKASPSSTLNTTLLDIFILKHCN